MTKPPKRPQRKKPKVVEPLPHHRTEEHVSLLQEKLIGRVIIAWSKLEAAMDGLIWALLKLDVPMGRLITKSMDANRKIQNLRALAEQRLPEQDFFDLSLLLDDVDVLREDRNFIAHGVWGRLLPENVPIAFSIREKSDPNKIMSEEFPDIRMRTIHFDIEIAKLKMDHHRERFVASPDKSDPPSPVG